MDHSVIEAMVYNFTTILILAVYLDQPWSQKNPSSLHLPSVPSWPQILTLFTLEVKQASNFQAVGAFLQTEFIAKASLPITSCIVIASNCALGSSGSVIGRTQVRMLEWSIQCFVVHIGCWSGPPAHQRCPKSA